MRLLAGFVCRRTRNAGGILWTEYLTLGFNKRRRVSWLSERLSGFQKGLWSMESEVSFFPGISHWRKIAVESLCRWRYMLKMGAWHVLTLRYDTSNSVSLLAQHSKTVVLRHRRYEYTLAGFCTVRKVAVLQNASIQHFAPSPSPR
jgi:hypothetical protein